jgi:hypothetical protein
MKKIFLLTVFASLFVACDETKNEQDIVNTFFGDGISGSRPRPENYDRMQTTENLYYQDFNSAATSDWSEKNDSYSLQGFESGELIIQGKKGFYTWKSFGNPNPYEDFQIEIMVQFNFTLVSNNDASMGIVFGVDDNTGFFHYVSLFNGENHVLQIGNYTGSAYNHLYSKPSDLTKNTHHLYTIRKVGTEVYFFADRKFKYKSEYGSFIPNYGFWLTPNGIVSVDYVSVDYIE